MDSNLIDLALKEILSDSPDEAAIAATARQLLDFLKSSGVFLYGGGASGRLLAQTLLEYGVCPKGFIDRAADTIDSIDGIQVIKPDHIRELEARSVILTASNLKSQSAAMMDTARYFSSTVVLLDGFAVNRILRYDMCGRRLVNGHTFDLIKCENCGFERHGCPHCMSYLRKVAGATSEIDDWRSRSFTWFGYIVGKVCTLKCIHCCEAVPFQKEHSFVPKDVIIKDVRKVASASRFLTFVELIGGEPFLHPDFKELIRELLEIKNIGYIKSFTNGTIVPSAELCRLLKHPRFMLQVSNYEDQATGKLLDNIRATRSVLHEQGVPYIFTRNFGWQDFSSFDLHHTDDTRLKEVFDACPLRNCNRLYNGTLYRCPHQYAGVELGVLKKNAVECVDINLQSERSLADALEAFENVDYIDACRCCRMPFDAPAVPAGVQLSRAD